MTRIARRAIASVLCLGVFVSACSASITENRGAGGTGGAAGSAGNACPLPATAELPPQCLACIHSSCPAVYDDLCAANCGAAELGAPCLSAQREIGTCLQSNCPFECQRTHGSAVGGAGGLAGNAGSGGATDSCSAALPLECGDHFDHSTLIQGRPNAWSLYASTQRAESGRETVYAFTTPTECAVIARLTNLHTDLDLLLVPRCDSVSSSKASSTPLDLQTDESISWTNPENQTSYVVVDGYAGAEGSYTLEVECICAE